MGNLVSVYGSGSSTAKLIDGKAAANSVLDGLRHRVAKFDIPPLLVVVLVGDDPASLSYVRRRQVAASQCGIRTKLEHHDEAIGQDKLQRVIAELDADNDVDGLIIQLPLPAHLDAKAASRCVSLAKDVDGCLPANVGAMALHGHEPLCCSCTPKGCLQLIKSAGLSLRGKDACVIGASNIVGIPMGALLLKEGCTVTTCHIDTVDCAAHSRRADVLVVAVGKAGLVTADWVKPGAIVIDVGINFVPDASKKAGQRMVGDVDYVSVSRVASFLTPVPGGVGPMTVAMLMSNTIDAYTARRRAADGQGAAVAGDASLLDLAA